MRKLDALAGAGKDHAVLADHVAAAQRGKADIALAPWTDIAVAHLDAALLQRHLAASRRRAAEHERGARGGVALMAVMHLQDLDIEFRAKRAGDLSGQDGEQIDALAHIAGL